MDNTNLKTESKQQTLTLINRNNLSISGIEKIISLKTNLIQLQSNFGGIIIEGENLQLLKLDNQNFLAEISGIINKVEFIEQKPKEKFLRKIFK